MSSLPVLLNSCDHPSSRAQFAWERIACWISLLLKPVSQFSKEEEMPEKETLERAEQDKREGKSPITQAGEFVREEIHHIREGKHGAARTTRT